MSYSEGMSEFFTQNFGRQRGRLYRSERDWNYGGGPNHKQDLKDSLAVVKDIRLRLHNEDGMSEGKMLMFIGACPLEFLFSNPELFMDDNESRRFFKENAKFSKKGL